MVIIFPYCFHNPIDKIVSYLFSVDVVFGRFRLLNFLLAGDLKLIVDCNTLT